MFSYLKPAVDSVQYVKTTFLNTFVKEENIREPLQEFVDKQAQFARDMLHAGDSLLTPSPRTISLNCTKKLLKEN